MKKLHLTELTMELRKKNQEIMDVRKEIERYRLFQRLQLDMDLDEVDNRKSCAYQQLTQLKEEKKQFLLELLREYKKYFHFMIQRIITKK